MRSASVLAVVLAVIVSAVVGIHGAYAEAPEVTKSPLMKHDMSLEGRLAVMVDVQIPPGAEEGRHSHPAELYVYVREGALTLESEGKETTTYKAGEVFNVGPGKVHNGMNKGDVTVKLLAVLIAEKGKPISSPAK